MPVNMKKVYTFGLLNFLQPTPGGTKMVIHYIKLFMIV